MDVSAGNEVLNTVLDKINQQILTPLLALLFLAAFSFFVWGVVQYIKNGADEEKRLTGQRHMIWGIIGLIIMFGAAAIVAVLKNILSILQ